MIFDDLHMRDSVRGSTWPGLCDVERKFGKKLPHRISS